MAYGYYTNSMQAPNRVYKAAAYLRLSREDEGSAESNSITNQRDLINDFVEGRKDLEIVTEYVDDGFSGSSFDERPAFQEMMNAIGEGEIDCIVVKDLSRFGRNYIESGRYLQRIFPSLGIRFIAINDNYDSLNEQESDQLLVPFKNLINDAYCRDISLKIRSQLEVLRKNGEFVGSYATYGYLKSPEDKHKLIVDPYAADVVRVIYNLKIGGMSNGNIAKKLDSFGIMPPLAYKRYIGINYNGGFRSAEDAGWSRKAVERILKDEIYTGTMVQGKTKKVNHRLKQCAKVPEEDWARVEGTHEAIIDRDDYELVQEILSRDTCTTPGNENVGAFSGYIRCGKCGQSMIHINSGETGYGYYRCLSKKWGTGCGQKLLSEKTLMSVFIGAAGRLSSLLAMAEEVIGTAEEGKKATGHDVRRNQLIALDKEIERLGNVKTALYQDLRDEVVTRDEFTELNSRFSKRIEEAQKRREAIEEEEKNSGEGAGAFPKWLEEFSKYEEILSVDRRLVTLLVDEIIVWDTEHIEIRFRFADEIMQLMEMAGLERRYESLRKAEVDK